MTSPARTRCARPGLRPGRARTRAQALLDACQDYGAELRFAQNATGTRVHVLAEPNIPAWAREDPPQSRPTIDEITKTVAGALLAVCGVRVRRHRGGLERGGRQIDHFPDELLCARCHAAFAAFGHTAAALIFEHNQEPEPEPHHDLCEPPAQGTAGSTAARRPGTRATHQVEGVKP